MIDPDSISWGPDGLVPAVVQDQDTRRVLMVGYQNREALAATVDSGWVHFWSRSRKELWEKGSTSGNRLRLSSILPDCDRDALLVLARPSGPACHTGTATCFDDGPLGAGFAGLEALWATIASRAATRPPDSYTARLLEGGPDLPLRKLMEEATEVLLAAKDHAVRRGETSRMAEEAADLIYHLLVVLADREVDPADVLGVLAARAR